MLESLEPRRLAAGTVYVKTTGGVTLITGDAAPNQVEIVRNYFLDGSPTLPGIVAERHTRLVVDGVDVRSQHYSFPGTSSTQSQRIVVYLNDGDDSLTVSGPLEPDALPPIYINGGRGNDAVAINYAIRGLAYEGVLGDDFVSVKAGVTIYGSADIRPGAGRNTVTFGSPTSTGDVVVRGNLSIVDDANRTVIRADRLRVKRQTNVLTESQSDQVIVRNSSFFGDVHVNTTTGLDDVAFLSCSFRAARMLDAGDDEGDQVRGV